MAIVSSTNTTPSDSSTAVYALKTTLVTAGWTVTQSGTGTSGTYGASDLITSAAVLSAAKAWFYIQSPNGQGFTFQNNNNSTSWRVKWRGNGGAVGTGAADKTPLITNEVLLRGSGTDASPGFTDFVPTNGSYRWNVIADNASPYGFWCGAIITGGTYTRGGLLLDPLTAISPGDVSPYIVLVGGSSDTWSNADNIYDEAYGSPTGNYYSAMYVASTGTGNVAKPHLHVPKSYGGYTIFQNSVVNPITGNDELYPAIWARRADAANGNPGWKGVSTFVKVRGIARSIGDTYSVSTSKDTISYNHLALPWDGSTPVI